MLIQKGLFGDIGFFEFDLQNLSLNLTFYTGFEEGLLNITVTELDFYVDPVTIDFDGMSDVSEYVTRFANLMVNSCRHRVISMLKSSL